MKLIHEIVGFCIGLVAGIGLAVAGLAMAQNPAQVQAQRNVQAALGTGYVKDSVRVNGSRVDILEDNKRNRVCYITFNAISCEVLDRRNPR